MRTIIRNKNEKSVFGARMRIGIVRKYFILIFILIYFDDSWFDVKVPMVIAW